MPPSRDSFRRNRVAPIDSSILPLFAKCNAACLPTVRKTGLREDAASFLEGLKPIDSQHVASELKSLCEN
jgi:hypothetical protein